MQLTSIVAIYFLFFAFSAFVLLPFGVKTDEEVGKQAFASINALADFIAAEQSRGA